MFTKGKFDADKISNSKEWLTSKCKDVLDRFEALCNEDRFTTGGLTSGELHLFSTLYQMKGTGAFDIVGLPPKLQKFYDRVAANEAVQRCIGGASKMGEQKAYLVPFPS